MSVELQAIWDWMVTRGTGLLFFLLLFVVVIFLVRMIGRGIVFYLESRTRTNDSYEEIVKRARTLTGVIRRVLIGIFILIGLIWILTELGVDLGPLLLGAGVVGVVVGLGAQKLIQDYLNGFFILVENQYRVGDVIQISPEISGLVESIGFRTTVIRDLEGRVHTIPNGNISVVTNFTKGFSRYALDIGVAYKENVDHVMKVLGEVGEDLRGDPTFGSEILEPIEVMGVQAFDDSAVVIRVRFTSKPSRQWDISREFRRRIKNRFDQEGIEIPFPHRTIYYGADRPERSS